MSLLQPQPYLRGEDRLRKIYGVGRMTSTRLRTKGLVKVEDLKKWLRDVKNGPGTQRQKRTRIEHLVNEVTVNRRARSCLEGYQVRLHNRVARNALVRFMRDQCRLSRALLPPWGSRTRDPKTRPFAKELVTAYGPGQTKPPYEGGWKWPHGPLKPTGKPSVPLYPDGRVPKMPLTLTKAQRDALIRGGAQKPRQEFPCSCFQSKETCQDFNPSRHNRPGNHLPSCRWARGECKDAGAAPPPRRHQPARRAKRKPKRK